MLFDEAMPRLALAPMAGVTDRAFRTICRRWGARYTVSEMVSAKAACFGDRKSRALWRPRRGRYPLPCSCSAAKAKPWPGPRRWRGSRPGAR